MNVRELKKTSGFYALFAEIRQGYKYGRIQN